MKEKIDIFLASDALEKYILGTSTPDEANTIEHYIDSFPEVQEQYIKLQESVEQLARLHSKPAPEGLKDSVLKEIAHSRTTRTSWYSKLSVAAVVLFACATAFFWNQKRILANENNAISSEIMDLKLAIEQSNAQMVLLEDELDMLNNPNTRKYVLNGNEKARKLQTVAYINTKDKLSLINVLDLPDIPEEKCFQMWANVDGEMVSLGVLEIANHKLLSVPYKENAIGYNITIEPKGGNKKPTVENTVANIALAN